MPLCEEIKKEDNIKDLNALIVYENFKEDRVKILKEQKDKSGVYCLINKINGPAYALLTFFFFFLI